MIDGLRPSRFARQVDAIASSWCSDEGHDFIRLGPGYEGGPSTPQVIVGDVPVRWCRNCGLTERIEDNEKRSD